MSTLHAVSTGRPAGVTPGALPAAGPATLSPPAFRAVTELFHRVSGIRLGDAKRALVASRLARLARDSGAAGLDQYVERLLHAADPAERVRVVDALTTNETYFFREPAHYARLAGWLRQRAPAGPGEPPLRIWSAASASGEEAYSSAMVLADHLGLDGWSVLGTDLSTHMVDGARRALYPVARAGDLPPAYLKRWCLKGQGEHAGSLLICRELRDRVRFEDANLVQPLPPAVADAAPDGFDVIFLRNVLIYFDRAGKADIVRRALSRLKPDGVLFTGHAETLANLGLPVLAIAPAVYTHCHAAA